MLYEMVTGARAFAGTSTAETLSAVIRAQPKAPSAVVPDVPSDLEKVILRCLRKDPQRRFQHIDDVKIALLDIKEESDSGAGRPAAVGRRRRTPLILLIAATVVLMSVAVAWLLRPSLRPAESAPMRLLSLTTVTGLEFDPTFRPTASRWRSHGMVPRRTIGTSTSPSSGRQMCADSRATPPRTSNVVARRPADRVPAGATRRHHSARVGAFTHISSDADIYRFDVGRPVQLVDQTFSSSPTVALDTFRARPTGHPMGARSYLTPLVTTIHIFTSG
jgi:serine/threonine protein kinase